MRFVALGSFPPEGHNNLIGARYSSGIWIKLLVRSVAECAVRNRSVSLSALGWNAVWLYSRVRTAASVLFDEIVK
jgi:hypothetical protein